ncbi:MAG: antitoxin [Candidatus Omnitrophica bacterium]|nr:antitoxin [Candidatus Omnitrophota bacterium]
MRRIKLTKEERAIEDALVRGEYINISKKEFVEIAAALEARKKNAVLNIRVNRHDLDILRHKAQKAGIKYQTFISEILHKVAEA